MDLNPSDPGNRDPAFIRDVALPVLNAVRTYYFRAELRGEDQVPREDAFVAVANHNGGPMLCDTWVMLSYWWTLFGTERPAYALVHDAPLRIPLLRDVLVKVGALRASAENSEKVLRAGHPLLIYPGGELDCLKSFWRRNRIDFHGRTGFVRLALRHGVPIVPIVNAGGHEVFITLFSSEKLAEWTGLAALTRVKTLPVNLGLPWGMWLTGFLPFIPLPAKLDYRVGEPIYLGRDPDRAHDAAFVQRAYGKVTRAMQGMLDDLSRHRVPVFG